MNSATYFTSPEAAELEALYPHEFDKARDLCEHLAEQQEPNYSAFLTGAVDDLVNSGRAVIRAMYAHRGIERVVTL